MSIEALRWALDVGEELELEPARRLVLIMLGNSADHAGGNLFPSYGYLSRRTGLAYSTIRAHIRALDKSGLLIKEPRARQDGGATSNAYRLSMRQAGLPWGDDSVSQPLVPPLLDSGRGGALDSRGPDRQPSGGGGEHTKVLKQERPGGRGTPTPVALAFQAYQQAIKAKYNADYPPSAKANGQLANVVGRVGRELVVAVVNWYLAHQDPFYARTKHSLDYLVRDCEKFSLEVQAASGAAAPRAPTIAKVALLGPDGIVKLELGEFPAGVLFNVARDAYKGYQQRAARMGAKSVAIRQGTERRVYTIEELTA